MLPETGRALPSGETAIPYCRYTRPLDSPGSTRPAGGRIAKLHGVLATTEAQLKPGGWLIMEFGFGQEDDVRALVARRASLTMHGTRADLLGLARTAIIHRR